jgi:hypothetical protein
MAEYAASSTGSILPANAKGSPASTRQIRANVEAIRDGIRIPAMREDLLALERRR